MNWLDPVNIQDQLVIVYDCYVRMKHPAGQQENSLGRVLVPNSDQTALASATKGALARAAVRSAAPGKLLNQARSRMS